MEQRIVEFVAALRAAGVRVSLAESEDAFRATDLLGVRDRSPFKSALKATLLKDSTDSPVFDRLFDIYFSSGGPPLVNPMEGLTDEESDLLKNGLRALLGDNDRLQQLLRYIMEGRNPSKDELDELGNRAGVPLARSDYQRDWLSRRIQRQLGMDQELQELIQQLLDKLREMGMTEEALQRLAAQIEANRDALAEQIDRYVGMQIAQQQADDKNPREPFDGPDLTQRDFAALSERDLQELRHQIRRLAARLRSRLALRQHMGKRGTLDAKRTIRTNLRNAAVPIEIRHKRRIQKPRLVILCDISTSVRPVVEFMLRLVFELHDQISKARPFVFIDDITDVTEDFVAYRPEVAVRRVLENNPPGYYNTNLGYSLAHFNKDFIDTVDHRTTFVILGDGRNNYLDPRLDVVKELKKRAKQLIWFNPEDPRLWGTGDSDMLQYKPLFNSVHRVSNLLQLTEAIDKLFEK